MSDHPVQVEISEKAPPFSLGHLRFGTPVVVLVLRRRLEIQIRAAVIRSHFHTLGDKHP
jgi:hypothetical protein